MDVKRGIAVCPGVAIGPALVLDTEGVRIPRTTILPIGIEAEVQRFTAALGQAAEAARERHRTLVARLGTVGKDVGNIFYAHALLFEQDQLIRRDVETFIRSEGYNAEYALSRAVRGVVKRLEESGGEAALRLRGDLYDLEKQVLGFLLGDRKEPIAAITQPVIVLAHDLTPSETAQLPRQVLAFATESGGPTSHTAILAGALDIPAVVGIGRFLSDVSGGDLVIVDGFKGLLIVDPDDATIAEYEQLRREHLAKVDPYLSIKDSPPVTRDGVRISLLGNIEFPGEAKPCLERGADGVGLYRTEFLYLNKTADPTEEEHFDAYREVIQSLGQSRPCVIRTLDLGADKFTSATDQLVLDGEKNPFLGLRSVRLCLKNRELFKTQLRAILRASALGDVRVMFPMVSTVMELRQCRALLREVQEDLDEAGIPYNSALPIGTMIEVPSAALVADVLAKQVDFFSIGTNDLVQYTLAADRNNEHVAGLYNPADPAVLRLIKMVADAGMKAEVDVTVCGEMSGEALYAPLLVGLGLRSLSATPRKIPEIKRIVRSLTLNEAERVAAEAMRLETAREVASYLREQLRRILPDAAD
jgi:phosphoenolpyruvate-protein phosphotransferase (PTS system enzyme I)